MAHPMRLPWPQPTLMDCCGTTHSPTATSVRPGSWRAYFWPEMATGCTSIHWRQSLQWKPQPPVRCQKKPWRHGSAPACKPSSIAQYNQNSTQKRTGPGRTWQELPCRIPARFASERARARSKTNPSAVAAMSTWRDPRCRARASPQMPATAPCSKMPALAKSLRRLPSFASPRARLRAPCPDRPETQPASPYPFILHPIWEFENRTLVTFHYLFRLKSAAARPMPQPKRYSTAPRIRSAHPVGAFSRCFQSVLPVSLRPNLDCLP